MLFLQIFRNKLQATLIGTPYTQGTATGDQNAAGCELSPPQIKVKIVFQHWISHGVKVLNLVTFFCYFLLKEILCAKVNTCNIM